MSSPNMGYHRGWELRFLPELGWSARNPKNDQRTGWSMHKRDILRVIDAVEDGECRATL